MIGPDDRGSVPPAAPSGAPSSGSGPTPTRRTTLLITPPNGRGATPGAGGMTRTMAGHRPSTTRAPRRLPPLARPGAASGDVRARPSMIGRNDRGAATGRSGTTRTTIPPEPSMIPLNGRGATPGAGGMTWAVTCHGPTQPPLARPCASGGVRFGAPRDFRTTPAETTWPRPSMRRMRGRGGPTPGEGATTWTGACRRPSTRRAPGATTPACGFGAHAPGHVAPGTTPRHRVHRVKRVRGAHRVRGVHRVHRVHRTLRGCDRGTGRGPARRGCRACPGARSVSTPSGGSRRRGSRARRRAPPSPFPPPPAPKERVGVGWASARAKGGAPRPARPYPSGPSLYLACGDGFLRQRSVPFLRCFLRWVQDYGTAIAHRYP